MQHLLAPSAAILVLIASNAANAQPADDFPFDFALREDFVRALKAGSILFSMKLEDGRARRGPSNRKRLSDAHRGRTRPVLRRTAGSRRRAAQALQA